MYVYADHIQLLSIRMHDAKKFHEYDKKIHSSSIVQVVYYTFICKICPYKYPKYIIYQITSFSYVNKCLSYI